MSMELSIKVRALVEEARRDIARFRGDVNAFGQSASASGAVANAGFSKTAAGVRSISEQLQTAKTQLIAFFGVQQAMRGAGAVVGVVTEFEQLNAQLKTLTGSKEAAGAVFEQIQQFALDTPYQLTDVTQTWIMLKARGIDPTTEAMSGLGNVAAAMGKGILEVTDSALQASVGNLETMRMMGFDVIAQGDKLKITFNGITQVVEKSSAGLISYFQKIGNTQFASAMADQMEKLGGALSNVSDNAQKATKNISDESGLTGAMTDSANAAAKWLGELDAREVVDAMRLAVSGLAGVMAMRMTPAVIEQVAHWRSQVSQLIAARAATIAAAQATLSSARAEETRTAALLAEAQAEKAAATAVNMRGVALTNINVRLEQATAAHRAATTALSSAQTRAAATSGLLATAGRGLLSLMGGIPGIIMGAVTAVGLWVTASHESGASTRDWREELLQLRGEMKALEQYQLDKKIRDVEAAITDMQAVIKGRIGFWSVLTGDNKEREEAESAIGDARRLLYALRDQREKLKAQSQTGEVKKPDTPLKLDEYALKKDALNRELAELERSYHQAEVSTEKYFTRRRDLLLQEIDVEIAERRAALETMGKDDEKNRNKTATEIAILERKRRDIKVEADRGIEDSEKELAQQLDDIRRTSLQKSGQQLDAQLLEIDAKYKSLLERLTADGNTAGVELVNKLINVEQAQARLDDIDRRVKAQLDKLRAAEQSSEARVTTGDTSPARGEAEQRQARIETIAQLRALRDGYAELAETVPQAKEKIAELDQQIADISLKNASGLELAIRDLRDEYNKMVKNFAGDTVRAARDSLAGFFYDLAMGAKSGKEALADFVRSFAQSMAQIASKALATFVILQTLDAIYPGLGKATAEMMGADVKHTGGIAGGGGVRRNVPAFMFAGAPRYHSGGEVLAPGEVPAILKAGEEVLTRDDPRHVANGGGQQGGSVRIVNVIDPAMVSDYMSSSQGEQVILNTLQRNPGAIKQLLA